MKILIIGASGFIGQRFLELTHGNNYEISTFSRHDMPFSVQTSGKKFIGDFTNANDLKIALQGQDIVYNFITTSNPRQSWHHPLEGIDVNLKPNIQFMQLAAECEVKKIVFTSSGGAIYGNQEGCLDEDSPTKPFSPYGITKLAIENYLGYAKTKFGLQNDIYRVSNPYGPGQVFKKNGVGVIANWLQRIDENKPIQVYGDIGITKDYIYIDDLVKFLQLSLTRPITSSEVFNASSGIGHSLQDIINILRLLSPKPFTVEHTSGHIADVKKVILNNQKILTQLPGIKLLTLEQGLERTLRLKK